MVNDFSNGILDAQKTDSEWQCLVHILKKNTIVEIMTHFQSYPYKLMKREEPDFEIRFGNGTTILLEITRTTTMRMEALRHLQNKSKSGVWAEVTCDLFNPSKPDKGEMSKNIIVTGQDLKGYPLYGRFAEVKWADQIKTALFSKKDKSYASSTDILLFDDRQYPYNSRTEIRDRYNCLEAAIFSDQVFSELNVFPYIYSDSPGSVGMIREEWKWICRPYFVSR